MRTHSFHVVLLLDGGGDRWEGDVLAVSRNQAILLAGAAAQRAGVPLTTSVRLAVVPTGRMTQEGKS